MFNHAKNMNDLRHINDPFYTIDIRYLKDLLDAIQGLSSVEMRQVLEFIREKKYHKNHFQHKMPSFREIPDAKDIKKQQYGRLNPIQRPINGLNMDRGVEEC